MFKRTLGRQYSFRRTLYTKRERERERRGRQTDRQTETDRQTKKYGKGARE